MLSQFNCQRNVHVPVVARHPIMHFVYIPPDQYFIFDKY